MPAAARPGLERGGLGRAVRLAGPERDGAAVGDQQRIERVDEVRAVASRRRARGRSARGSRAARRTRRARAGRRRGRPGGGSRGPGRRTPRPNAGPGPLHEDLAQAARSCSGRRRPASRSAMPLRIAAPTGWVEWPTIVPTYPATHVGLRGNRHRRSRGDPGGPTEERRAPDRSSPPRRASDPGPSMRLEDIRIFRSWLRTSRSSAALRPGLDPDDVLPVPSRELALT